MPLTFELCTKAGDYFCHCLIDRNNLIFVFPDTDEGYKYRQLISIPGLGVLPIFNGPFTPIPESAAHQVQDHMCSYDKDRPHMHYKLTKDVDYRIVKFFFDVLKKERPVLSNLDIDSTLKICREYFADLEATHQAKKIETEYRVEKASLFSKPTTALEDEIRKDHTGEEKSAEVKPASFFPKKPASGDKPFSGFKRGFLLGPRK